MDNANTSIIDQGLTSVINASSYRLIDPEVARGYITEAIINRDFGHKHSIDECYTAHTGLDERMKTRSKAKKIKILEDITQQLLPGEKDSEGDFSYFIKNNPLVVAGFAYSVAKRLDTIGKKDVAKQVQDEYEHHAKKMLETSKDDEKIVLYASGSVTEKIAKERYRAASAFEKGLIEAYFPKIDEDGFIFHLDSQDKETLKKIERDLLFSSLFRATGFNIGSLVA